MYEKLVRISLVRPRVVISMWLSIAFISGLVATGGLGDIDERGYSVAGSETARVNETLRRDIPDNTGTTIFAVLRANRPPPKELSTGTAVTMLGQQRSSDIEETIRRLQRLPNVISVERVATESEEVEGSIAGGALLAIVPIRLNLSYTAAERYVPEIENVLKRASADYVSFGLVGGVIVSRRYSTIVRQDLAHAEQIALPLIFVFLVIAFLSVVAAALPIMLAAISLATTLICLHLLSLQVGLSIFIINTASALALGLSVDYALIIVTRFREERQSAGSVEEAISRTMQTAGRAVMLSGMTIVFASSSLMAVGVGLFSSIALGGIVAGIVAVSASTTLLPAAILLLDDRLDRFTFRPAARASRRRTLWRWLAGIVTAHPIASALMSLAVLLALAAPSISLQLDFRNVSGLPSSDPVTRELKRVSAVFGPGADGLVEIVTKEPLGVAKLIQRTPNERTIWREVEGKDGWYAMDVVLKVAPDSDAARNTVSQLRRELHGAKGTTMVGGVTASEIDLTSRVASRTPLVIAIAMLIGLIGLAAGLRSIVVPLKAVLCSVLSVAATLGVLLDWFPSSGSSSSLSFFVPLVIFVLVFGLSIDYEVFLLSRIREAVRAGHSTKTATSIGLIRSGRPIALAALTVAIVFAALSFSSLEAMRQLGAGMAIAIVLDVSIVRCVLVPACVVLLGRLNWWFPMSGKTHEMVL